MFNAYLHHSPKYRVSSGLSEMTFFLPKYSVFLILLLVATSDNIKKKRVNNLE
jgi:hypothetical protein